MSKISSYGAQTAPAGGDLTVEVDVSDTSMASTGTDKQMTLSTLGQFVTGWHDLVRDFGADPTGSTSIATPLSNACTAAVAAQPAPYALAVPPGSYKVTAPQDLPYNMILKGAGANGADVTGQYTGTWFQVASTFSGAYVFGFKDNPAPSTYTGVNGCYASDFGIFGGAQTGTAVNGLYILGPTVTTLRYVTMTAMTGWAVATGEDSGAAESFPFTQNWFRVIANSCATVSGGGFQLVGCEDSVFMNCLSLGNNHGDAWYISQCDNTKFIGCNGEWSSAGNGFHITGDWAYFIGGCQFVGCTTDANGENGMLIDATWTTGIGAGTGPAIINVTGCHFRRDGKVSTVGTGTYAGLAFGATTLPVIVSNFSTMSSVGDGSGNEGPTYGVYFSQSSYSQPVFVGQGLAWGYTHAVLYSGGSANAFPTGVTNANVLLAHGAGHAPTYGS